MADVEEGAEEDVHVIVPINVVVENSAIVVAVAVEVLAGVVAARVVAVVIVVAIPIVHVANRAVVGEALHLGDVSSAWTSWRPWRMQVLSLKTIKLGTSRWSRVMLLVVGG